MSISILIIAFALSMDAFAVSVSNGIGMKMFHVKHALWIALHFGLFQAVMPIIGWLAGFGMKRLVEGMDHWIAFALLLVIGLKMIWESKEIAPEKKNAGHVSNARLLFLSIATSMDALAVGFTLPLLNVSLIASPIIIGTITFAVSLLGVFAGNRFGHLLENKMEALGGIILILIGLKILAEHSGWI